MNQEKKEKSVEDLNKEIQDYIKSLEGKEITPEFEKQINFAKSIFKMSNILKAAQLEQEKSAKLISQINSIVGINLEEIKETKPLNSTILKEYFKKIFDTMDENKYPKIFLSSMSDVLKKEIQKEVEESVANTRSIVYEHAMNPPTDIELQSHIKKAEDFIKSSLESKPTLDRIKKFRTDSEETPNTTSTNKPK